MLDRSKISLIHVAKAELGLDEDTYRAALQNHAGVDSSVLLTAAGFAAVMNHFMRCGFKGRVQGSGFRVQAKTNYQKYLSKWEALGDRPGMASERQLAMIEAVWDTLSWWWNADGQGDREKALNGFIKKRFESVERLRFLSAAEAFKITEALKSIQARRPHPERATSRSPLQSPAGEGGK